MFARSLQMHCVRVDDEEVRGGEHFAEVAHDAQVLHEDDGVGVRNDHLRVSRARDGREQAPVGHCVRAAHARLLPHLPNRQ